MTRVVRTLTFFILLAGTLQSLAAQGCAMCKTSLAAQSDQVVGTLQLGILVLLVPCLAIMGTFAYLVLRREPEPPSSSRRSVVGVAGPRP